MRIKISTGSAKLIAELNSSKTAKAIWDALPFEAIGERWGDEIYFSIPVELGPENPKSVVEEGDLGYWPPGNAFCIFFGPTPASKGNEIRPASPVNVFGKIIGDSKVLKNVKDGTKIRIEKV